MNYFFKKIPLFLLFLFLIFSAIFANSYKYLEAPKNFIIFFVGNIANSLWVFSGKIEDSIFFITRLSDVYYEISDLKNQNQELLSQNTQLKSQLEKNEFLATIADIKKTSEWNLQLTEIIGIDTQNWHGFFIINNGFADDLRPGLAVVTKDKFLVGKIIETNKNFSKVMTIFHPDSKIAAMTQDSHVFGILSGDYIGSLIMDMMDKNKNITEEELVITSGRDGIFPEGLIIGRVKNFQSKPEDLFQTANIKGFLDIYNLNKILVITSF